MMSVRFHPDIQIDQDILLFGHQPARVFIDQQPAVAQG